MTKKMTYKVVGIKPIKPLVPAEENRWRIEQAAELKHKYGLNGWGLDDIVRRWEAYSDTYSAGWLVDSKESVEEVFGVILEEVSDGR